MTVHILSRNIIFLSFKNSISSTVESQTNGLHIFWQVELISNMYIHTYENDMT